MSDLLDCPLCIDGIEYHHDPIVGDWEELCKWCSGSGKLNAEKSERLRKLRIAYFEKKSKEE